MRSAWAQYTIKSEKEMNLKLSLVNGIYYNTTFKARGLFSLSICLLRIIISERLSKEVLSLPLSPYMNNETIDKIAKTVVSFFEIAK